MAVELLKNLVEAEVAAGGFNSSATSVNLKSGHGAKLPSAPHYVTVYNATDYASAIRDPDREIILILARSGDSISNMVRGVGGTTAKNHNLAGKTYVFIQSVTAEMLGEFMGIAEFNVKSYGAKGDGTTDDSSAIAAAIAAMPSAGGKFLYFPDGDYKITQPVLPKNRTHIIAATPIRYDESSGGVRIKYTGSDVLLRVTGREWVKVTGIKMEIASPAVAVLEIKDTSNWCTFENCVFTGYGTTTGIGAEFSGQTSCSCHHHFIGCRFNNLNTCVQLSGFANANLFEQCAFYNSGTAIAIKAVGSDTTGGDDNVFLRCEIAGTITTGIDLNNSSFRNLFIKVVEDGTLTTGLSIDASSDDSVFMGCVFTGAFNVNAGSQTIFMNCSGAGLDGKGVAFSEVGVNLYRGALDTLKTDGNLALGADMLIGASNELILRGGGFIEGLEIADPSAPAADKGRLYFRDNGSGKTQLVVRFPTGAVQVIATEP